MKITIGFISLTALWLASIVLQCIAQGENIGNTLGWVSIISTFLVGVLPALNNVDNEVSKKMQGFGPIRIIHILTSLVSLFLQGLR